MTAFLRHAPSLSFLASAMEGLFPQSTPEPLLSGQPLSLSSPTPAPTPSWSGAAQSPQRQERQERQGSDDLLDAAEKGAGTIMFVVRVA